jgi:hypothetical protein
MEKLSAIVGFVLSLLSLGSAYDSFTTIELLPKLLVTGVAALLVIFSAAHWFARHLAPDQPFIGYGVPEPDRSIPRFSFFSFLLAVLSALFILLALYLTERFTLQLRETTAADKSATLLIAPDASIDSVTLELPRKTDASCDWQNRSLGDLPPLAVQMIGWDSPTPQLHIDDFVFPQRIEIDCKPAHSIRGGIILPKRTVVYLANTLRMIQIAIVIAGGLVWLAACFATWLWSE